MCLLRLISYIPEIHSSNHIYAVFSWTVKLLPVRVLHMVFVWWWSGTVFKKQMKDCILWHYRMSPVVSVSALWPLNSSVQFLSDVSLKLETFAQSLIWSIWSPTFGFSRTKGRNNMKFYLKVYHFDILQIVLRWRSIANVAISVLILVQYVCNVCFMLKWRYASSWCKKLATDFKFFILWCEAFERRRNKAERRAEGCHNWAQEVAHFFLFFCFTMISTLPYSRPILFFLSKKKDLYCFEQYSVYSWMVLANVIMIWMRKCYNVLIWRFELVTVSTH